MKTSLTISRIIMISYLLVSVASCTNTNKPDHERKTKKTKTDKSNHVVLINPFEVPEGKLEEAISYWEACRDFLKEQPGYVSTNLHKSIKDGAKFELINVAVWENPKAFSEAAQKMVQELGVAPVEGLKPTPSLYTIVRQ